MNTTHHPLRNTLIAIWAWPLLALLIVGLVASHGKVLWFLCKGTWVLFAGVVQSFALFSTEKWKQNRLKWYMAVVCMLTLTSFLLLPFGLAKWGLYMEYDINTHWTYVFKMNPSFGYDKNIWLSMALHLLVPLLPIAVVDGLTHDTGVSFGMGPSSCSDASFSDGDSGGCRRGSGLWGGRTWLDDVWKGGQVSDDFIGRHGEFDLNDEARRVSEDMQQFHRAHPDADLSDHYYWDDVLDAETDDYLDD